MNDVKRCSKCKMDCLKLNFYKDITRKDVLRIYCKSCTIQYHNNRKEQRKNYEKNKRKIDFNFKLAHNVRVRTRQAFKSQNVEKLNETFDSFGCSQSFLRKWILYQLHGKMTAGNYGSVWTIDHCYPLSKTKLSIGTDRFDSSHWINLRPMFYNQNSSKGCKIDNHLYLLQQVKAKYFLKLNAQEG